MNFVSMPLSDYATVHWDWKYPVPERLKAVLYGDTINIAAYLFHQAANYLEDAWYFLSLMTTRVSLFQQWGIGLGGCVTGRSL
jgi:hypothetical protein